MCIRSAAMPYRSVAHPRYQVAQSAKRLRSPLLLVTAREDQFGAAYAAPDILKSAPVRDKHLVEVGGADHGTDLLSGPESTIVIMAIMDFLARVEP